MIVKIYQDSISGDEPEVSETDNLFEFLQDRYGDSPKFPIDLFVGEPDYSTKITGEIDAVLNAKQGLYSIVERPAELAVAFQVFVAFVSLVMALSAEQPKAMPSNVNRNQQSGNNEFGTRSNTERLYQRVEDIFGKVLAIPSKLMPEYHYFSVAGDKFERGYYCLGRGYFDKDTAQASLKDATTLLTDIPGARASWYNPFTAPDGLAETPLFEVGGGVRDPVDTRIDNVNIDGVTLLAPNQSQLSGRHGYGFYNNKIVQIQENPAFSTVFVIGEIITVTMPYDVGSGNTSGYYYYIPSGSPIDGHSDTSNYTAGSNGVAQTNIPVGPYVSSDGALSWATITYTAVSSAKTFAVDDTEAGFLGYTTYAALIVGDIIRGNFNGVEYRGTITGISHVGTVYTFTMDIAIANATAQSATFGAYVNYSGDYTISSIAYENLGESVWLGSSIGTLSAITLTTSPFVRPITSQFGVGFGEFPDDFWVLYNGEWIYTITGINAIVEKQGATSSDGYTPYFKLLNEQQTKLQINLTGTQGLYKQALSTAQAMSVTVEFTVQRLISGIGTGTEFVTTLTVSSHQLITSDPTGATLVVDLQTLCGFIGACQIKAKRTTDHDFDFAGTVSDQVQWEKVYSILPVTKLHFGNKTTIQTDTQLNQKALVIRSRQLNVLAYRKLPTWNGTVWSGTLDSTGLLTSGTLNATKNPVDIIGEITRDKKIGNRPITDVDVAQIASVIADINSWNASCSEFSYTFDSDATSYGQHIDIVANAVFCEAYRQNAKIRLAFDKPQASSSALITHRSKQPGAVDTVKRSFFDDSDFDGIQMVYPDPDTLKNETFYLPLSGNFVKAKKIEIPGIRNFTQAWMRANREYNRIFNQRVGLRTTMTMEAAAFTPNMRIDVVDNTQFMTYAGEALGYDLLTKTMTLSDDVVFKSGMSHTLVLAKRNGSQESISCTAGAFPYQVVLATNPVEPVVVVSGIDGIRTIYSFAAEDDREAMAYRMRKVSYVDQFYATVDLVNYSENDYLADDATVPSRIDIIGA